MRIVSLLPSATEILFALGFDREIVGVSHECDFPPKARTKPVVIHSRMPHDASPAEIDALVREYVHRGESLYAVDAGVLETLAPDLIVTQDLCHVCAASPDDLATALTRFDRRPEVLCLNPQDLGDVWRDILWVGEETCHGPQAEARGSGTADRLVERAPARRVSRMAATVLRRRPLGCGNDSTRGRGRFVRACAHAVFPDHYRTCDGSRARNPADRAVRVQRRTSSR